MFLTILACASAQKFVHLSEQNMDIIVRERRPYSERRQVDIKDYKKLFRFHPDSVEWLAQHFLGDDSGECRGGRLCNKTKMEVFLRHLADPGFQIGVAEDLGISQPSVSNTFSHVLGKVTEKAAEWIHFPSTSAEMSRAKEIWQEKYKFPMAIGVIDCTHVRIQAPPRFLHPEEFINRKNFHSYNVQVTCDGRGTVTSVVAKWPGGVHDSRILRNSPLPEIMERHDRTCLLLGDSGYGITPWLMTPYRQTDSPAKVSFNNLFTKERVIIERTFGIVKKRFPLIGGTVRLQTEKIPRVVLACMILHNAGLHLADEAPEDDIEDVNIELPDDVAMEDGGNIRQQGQRRRDIVANLILQMG